MDYALGVGACAYVRFPKIALPTRTRVEPEAMAASRSSLMPMDRVSNPNPA